MAPANGIPFVRTCACGSNGICGRPYAGSGGGRWYGSCGRWYGEFGYPAGIGGTTGFCPPPPGWPDAFGVVERPLPLGVPGLSS